MIFIISKDGERLSPSRRFRAVKSMDLHGILITNAHTIDCDNNRIVAIFATNAKQINCKNNDIKFLYAPILKHLKSDNITEKDIPNDTRIYINSENGIEIIEKIKRNKLLSLVRS